MTLYENEFFRYMKGISWKVPPDGSLLSGSDR